MSEEELYRTLIEKYYRISNKSHRIKSKTLSFGDSIPLNTISIHLIDTIGNNPDANMTEIAKIMYVTKGAISQVTTKLEENGLIEREKSEDKNIRLHLTKKGLEVYKGHEELHKKMYADFTNILKDFSTEDVKKMIKTMDKISDFIDIYNHGML